MARHPGPALVVAAVLWGAAGLVSRAAPLPGPVLAFWRCLVGAGIYQGVLAARGRRPSWHDLRVAALGGIGFGLSVAFLFVAYKTTTLLSANVIACLQPLVLGLVAHRYAGRLEVGHDVLGGHALDGEAEGRRPAVVVGIGACRLSEPRP